MILDCLLLQSFTEAPKVEKPLFLEVPIGSKPLALQVEHDGLYVWYEKPTIIVGTCTIMHSFMILKKGSDIPKNAVFMGIVDLVYTTDKEEQAIIVFPVYRLEN